jgi:hypothetical protein
VDLVQRYKSDGIIVAQIGLVEANLLANSSHDPALVSYLAWPVNSSLPHLKEEDVAILPYSLNQETQDYLVSLVYKAASYRRIWLVGGGEVLAQFRHLLVHEFGYILMDQSHHGQDFYVFLLERNIATTTQSQGF